MKSPHSNHTHNINRFSINEAIACRTNLLIQKRLTKYIGNLLIPKGKLSFGQPLKHKNFRISQLVLQIFYFKSHPKLSFCGCDYCEVIS